MAKKVGAAVASGLFNKASLEMAQANKKFITKQIAINNIIPDKVYNDYVKVYELTGKQVSKADLDCISRLSEEYGASANQVDTIFSILYMAMIAEERKAGTRLGKRIKRLGIHKLLIENIPVREAANFMRGMGWRDIARLCEERGF